MCLSNIKDVYNVKPKCFCDETCWTGLLLRKIGGYTTFLTLRLKIIFYPCLDGQAWNSFSTGKTIPLFYLNPHRFV